MPGVLESVGLDSVLPVRLLAVDGKIKAYVSLLYLII